MQPGRRFVCPNNLFIIGYVQYSGSLSLFWLILNLTFSMQWSLVRVYHVLCIQARNQGGAGEAKSP